MRYMKLHLKGFSEQATGWYVVLSSKEDLMSYIEGVDRPRTDSAVRGVIRKLASEKGLSHYSSNLEAAFGESMKYGGPNAIDKMIEGSVRWKAEAILWKGERVYLGPNGGGFPAKDEEIRNKYDVLDEKESPLGKFPEDDAPRWLAVSRWPNGSHWYAKLGELDVQVGNDVKWNSKREAIEAAKTYAAKEGIVIRNIGDLEKP